MKLLILGTFICVTAIAQANPRLEPLLGFLKNHEGLIFQVYSGGCTTKDDFIVVVSGTYRQEVRLIRTNPDHCRAHLAYGTLLKFSYNELSIDQNRRFFIVNPVQQFRP